jgi:hypothetical protein
MRVSHLLLASLVLASSLAPALAAANDGWDEITDGAIRVRTRDVPGTDNKEVWAEGQLNAPAHSIQETLLDEKSQPSFMPYLKMSLPFDQAPDGTHLLYSRIDPPVVAPRDYVVRVHLDEQLAADGSGEFRSHWELVDGRVRERNNVVRLHANSGGWEVKALPSGQSWFSYRFVADPGGGIPGFIEKSANRKGVLASLRAVEKEAQRRQESGATGVAAR